MGHRHGAADFGRAEDNWWRGMGAAMDVSDGGGNWRWDKPRTKGRAGHTNRTFLRGKTMWLEKATGGEKMENVNGWYKKKYL